MRTLKKTLSLVLALVLCLGLVGTAFASSYDKYTDAAEVGAAYKEAVDVLKGIGVVDGVSATELNPTGTYTREQAAKIVAYLKLGKVAADKLSAAKAPFDDVAADRWSAGYISYCVDAGIIKGYGDGKFGPADALTGYAFGAMLLRALGYGVNGEYDGAGYSIKVAQDAIPLNIYAGDLGAAVNTPIERQQAMLMAFNALTKVATVQWSTLIGNYVLTGTSAGVIGSAVDPTYLAVNFKLDDRNVDNDKGALCREWYYTTTGKAVDGVEKYNAMKVIGTVTNGTELAAMTTKGNPAFVAELGASYAIYENGAWQYKNDPAVNKTVADYVNGSSNKIGRGDIVTLYDAYPLDGKIDRITIEKYTVATLYSDPVVTAATETVKISDIFGATAKSIDYVVGYDKVAKGDVVMYATMNGTTYIKKCTTVEGVITKYTAASAVAAESFTIGEKAYNLSEMVNAAASLTPDYKTSKTYYLDDCGYIVKEVGANPTVPTYYGLYLDDAQVTASLLGHVDTSKIQIFTADGEKVTYDLVTALGKPAVTLTSTAINGWNDGDKAEAGTLISYKLNANGAVLVDSIAAATATATNTQVKITNKASSVDGITGDYVNSNTLFFFYEAGTPAKMNVIKGYANVNTTTIAAQSGVSGAGYFMSANGTLPAMVAYSPVGTTASYVYITSTAYSAGLLADGRTTYAEYKTADGSIKMTSTKDSGDVNNYAVGAYSIDTNPATGLSVGTKVNAVNAEAVLGDATYFVANDTAYTIAPTTKVFEVTYNDRGQVVAVEAATMRVNSADEWVTVEQMNVTGTTANVIYFSAKPATAYAAAPALSYSTAASNQFAAADATVVAMAKTDRDQDVGATTTALKIVPVAGTTVAVTKAGSPVAETAAGSNIYLVSSGEYTVTVSRANALPLVYTITVA